MAGTTVECNSAIENGRDGENTGNLINRSGFGCNMSTATGANNVKSFATTMAKQRKTVELFDVAGKV